MKRLFIFPGQGSQKVGMGKDLYQAHPKIKALFDQADQVVGKSISTICFDGPEDLLKQTENAQMGIFLVSAALLILLDEKGIKPTLVAGHSLGELTAYYCAGVFSLEQALDVIRVRGQVMAKSYPSEKSAMAAVLGLDAPTLEEALKPFANAPVVGANYNCPGQIVISGERSAFPQAIEALKAKGAKRVIELPVSGAFHSPLMNQASDKFRDYLQDKVFSPAKYPILLNRTAAVTQDAKTLHENLALQVKSPVKWMQGIETIQNDIDEIIEIGPGKVLSGLVRKTLSEKPLLSIEVEADLGGIQT